MELEEIRKEIDLVNADLLKLIEKRMDLVQHVTTYKRQHQLPVLDASREQFILKEIGNHVKNQDYKEAVIATFAAIMAASRNYQEGAIKGGKDAES